MLDSSSIDSREGFFRLVKLSVLLPLKLIVRCRGEEEEGLGSGGGADFWKTRGGLRGGSTGGFLSPTSVRVETSWVRGRGDGISLSKCSSRGLWPTFSNSSVSVSDSHPLKYSHVRTPCRCSHLDIYLSKSLRCGMQCTAKQVSLSAGLSRFWSKLLANPTSVTTCTNFSSTPRSSALSISILTSDFAIKKLAIADTSGTLTFWVSSGSSDLSLSKSSIVNFGRLESKIDGASVANAGGRSSSPGKREFRKWPSNWS